MTIKKKKTGTKSKKANGAQVGRVKSNLPNDKSKITKPEPPIEEGDVDSIPYSIGHALVVKFRDESHRVAKIISRSEMPANGNETKYQYYIHYLEFNRRMDEWINEEAIIHPPSVANPLEKEYNIKHGHAPAVTASATETSENQDKKEINEEEEDENEEDENEEDEENQEECDGNEKKGVVSSKTLNLNTNSQYVMDHDHDEHEGMDEAALKEHEEITKIKNIKKVLIGKHYIECWYYSPYPKEFIPTNGPIDCLYICEFTLRFFKTKNELMNFQQRPNLPRHPPGNEIYRDRESDVSVFEIDGAVEKVYCQNLCYFAKLFLDHKTLYWDVDPFLFYVVTVRDNRGFHPVGFYSKEKYSDMGYNLACILTFPFAQRKGYGRFIIQFSYELSKKEKKIGSPEKPLSDLGAVGYKSYWAVTLLHTLRNFEKYNSNGGEFDRSSGERNGNQVSGESNREVSKTNSHITIMDLARLTSILPDDIIQTLITLGILRINTHDGVGQIIDKNTTVTATLGNNVTSSAGSGGGAGYGRGAPTAASTAPAADTTNAASTAIKGTSTAYDYLVYATNEYLDELILKYAPSPGSNNSILTVNPEYLQWTPLYTVDYKKDKWSILGKMEFQYNGSGGGKQGGGKHAKML